MTNLLPAAAQPLLTALTEREVTGHVLTIDITDNGPGFPIAPGLSGNGLRNIKRRLTGIGGDCDVSILRLLTPFAS